MIELFLDKGGKRIAVHRLKNGRNQYATEPEHMPDRLRAVRDIREPDYGDILLERARKIGPNAVAWAERCFASRDFPEQAFASCASAPTSKTSTAAPAAASPEPR